MVHALAYRIDCGDSVPQVQKNSPNRGIGGKILVAHGGAIKLILKLSIEYTVRRRKNLLITVLYTKQLSRPISILLHRNLCISQWRNIPGPRLPSLPFENRTPPRTGQEM